MRKHQPVRRPHRRPDPATTSEHLRRLIVEVLRAPVPPQLKTWTRI